MTESTVFDLQMCGTMLPNRYGESRLGERSSPRSHCNFLSEGGTRLWFSANCLSLNDDLKIDILIRCNEARPTRHMKMIVVEIVYKLRMGGGK